MRNFPLSVEELRKRTKITDGGHVYLFATTLVDGEKGAGQVFQSLIDQVNNISTNCAEITRINIESG